MTLDGEYAPEMGCTGLIDPTSESAPAGRTGRFIVFEGGDGAGRSTQVRLLLPWLEEVGWAAVHIGLGRSPLVGRALGKFRQMPESGAKTLALLYAADLADQAERRVIGALDAGFVVVADRWTVSALARCMVRGISAEWMQGVLPVRPEPDATIHIRVPPPVRLGREISKRGLPDHSESGRDLGLDADPLRSFVKYQALLDRQFERFGRQAPERWHTVEADADTWQVQSAVRRVVSGVLGTGTEQVSGG